MGDTVTPTFGSRFMTEPIPKHSLPENSMNPDAAYHLIHDELQVQGNPTLNMASFVTTVMDEQAERLIRENLGVNYIDTEVYRGALEIQDRCIKILGNLFNAPDSSKVWGTEAIGSSEALMVCAVSHKRARPKVSPSTSRTSSWATMCTSRGTSTPTTSKWNRS